MRIDLILQFVGCIAGCFLVDCVGSGRWRLHDQVEKWISDRWSWQEIFWRLWGGCFWVRCQFAPSRLPLAQIRPRVDRLLIVTGGEGVDNEKEFGPGESPSGAGVAPPQVCN